MQELFKFKMRWGLPYILVRWAGCDASRDTWGTTSPTVRRPLQLSSGRRAALCHALPRFRRLLPALQQLAAPLPIPPAGYTIDAVPPAFFGAELVGQKLLYRWQADG